MKRIVRRMDGVDRDHGVDRTHGVDRMHGAQRAHPAQRIRAAPPAARVGGSARRAARLPAHTAPRSARLPGLEPLES